MEPLNNTYSQIGIYWNLCVFLCVCFFFFFFFFSVVGKMMSVLYDFMKQNFEPEIRVPDRAFSQLKNNIFLISP